jgi:hypothetical protein
MTPKRLVGRATPSLWSAAARGRFGWVRRVAPRKAATRRRSPNVQTPDQGRQRLTSWFPGATETFSERQIVGNVRVATSRPWSEHGDFCFRASLVLELLSTLLQ